MNLRKLFCWRNGSDEEKEEAKQKYNEVSADDARVARLDRRVNRIMNENNFAPAIMKALGAKQ